MGERRGEEGIDTYAFKEMYITLRTHLNAGTINCDFRDWEKNREIKYPH